MKYLFILSFIAFIFSGSPAAADRWGSDKSINPSSSSGLTRTRSFSVTSQPKSTAPAKAPAPTKTAAPSKTNSTGQGENLCNNACPDDKCVQSRDGSYSCNGNSVPENDENADAPAGSMADAAIQQCARDSATAASDCDQDQDEGVQGAQSTLTNFAVGMGSQMGIAAACSGLAKYVAGANAAVVYFTQNCSSARTTCMKSCEQARAAVASTPGAYSYAPQIDSYYNGCRNLDAKIAEAKQAMNNMVGTVQASQSCASQTDMGSMDFCKSNPTAVGCANMATDCSNPQVAASNPICVCKANPKSAACTGAQAKAGDLNGGSYDAASTSVKKNSGGSSSLDADGMLSGLEFAGNGMTPTKGSAEDVGGNKGGRPLLDGGGGGGSGGDAQSGGGGSGQAVGVNAGFRGGGGGGGWGGSNGSNNGGGGAGYGGAAARPGANGPNLRDFLPNGKLDPKMANRGLAGISGPDGITGPHSDIWKKIQNRYQIHMEKATLMP